MKASTISPAVTAIACCTCERPRMETNVVNTSDSGGSSAAFTTAQRGNHSQAAKMRAKSARRVRMRADRLIASLRSAPLEVGSVHRRHRFEVGHECLLHG